MPDENLTNDVAAMLFQIVKARYGDRLSEAQLQAVQQGVEGIETLSQELRKIRLDNAVEPFAYFTPYRGDDGHE
jgi:hypothetical protein